MIRRIGRWLAVIIAAAFIAGTWTSWAADQPWHDWLWLALMVPAGMIAWAVLDP